MSPHKWLGTGALLAGLGVALGAFGAHGLKDRLVEAGMLENWHTAVRYQVWHALALVAVGLWRRTKSGGSAVGWCFVVGALLFSGSLYGLCLGGPSGVLGPITPLGGLLLLVGWGLLALEALRAED